MASERLSKLLRQPEFSADNQQAFVHLINESGDFRLNW